MEKKIYKTIPGFPDYKVSNYGDVISYKRKKEGELLKPIITGGYIHYNLYDRDKKYKRKKAHALVAEVFLGFKYVSHKEGVINHKDSDKLNNHIDNLEIVSNRENTSHGFLHHKTYIGTYVKERKKYRLYGRFYGKKHYIGDYPTKELSTDAYMFCVNNINKYNNINDLKKALRETIIVPKTYNYKIGGGVYYVKSKKIYSVELRHKNKKIFMGGYVNKSDAQKMLDIAKKEIKNYKDNAQYREYCKKKM